MTEPRLTTHVLDLTRGLPAAGLGVTLSRLRADGRDTCCAVVTNADGRTDAPLLEGAALGPGRYELEFAVGAYFAGRADGDGAEPYLDVVPIRFGVGPDVVHLHVALLVTPWAYSTYRGS